MIRVVVGVVVTGLLVTATARAADGTPPPPVAVTATEPVAPQPDCFPTCRAGFLCHEGQCVSRCNPLCPAGTECTNEATCVAVTAQTPAASVPAASAASPPQEAQPEELVRDTPPPPRDRTHHGFFLRLGLGAGYLRDTTTYQAVGRFGGGSVSRDGIAQVGELSLGGSPLPRLVIGGGIYGSNSWGDSQTINSSFIGPFLAYYLQATGGLSVMAAPCMSLNLTTREDVGPYSSASYSTTKAGWGFVTGVGYDGWVSDNWSLGGLLRVQYTTVYDDDQSDRSLFIPSLLFSATYY